MQENPDNDNLGNPCDDDDDGDRVPDDEVRITESVSKYCNINRTFRFNHMYM